MTDKRVVMVVAQIETDDPRLFPDNIDISTAESTATLRRLVIEHLAHVTRIIAVTSEENMRLMFAAHEYALRSIGEGDLLRRPPADYRPPN